MDHDDVDDDDEDDDGESEGRRDTTTTRYDNGTPLRGTTADRLLETRLSLKCYLKTTKSLRKGRWNTKKNAEKPLENKNPDGKVAGKRTSL